MSKNDTEDILDGINKYNDPDLTGIFLWRLRRDYTDAKARQYEEEEENIITGMTAEERQRFLNDDEFLEELALQQDLERARKSQYLDPHVGMATEVAKQYDSDVENPSTTFSMQNRVFAKYQKLVKMIDEIPEDQLKEIENNLTKRIV